MGSISVAIELRDDFTNMLYQMAESVNFRISDSGSLPSLPTVDVRIHPVLPDPVIPQQAPVRIPVQWQSGGPEVFGGSGMERYRQEVQSTDAMLARLSHMQNSIARQAYNTSISPPEGFRDLNRMAVRMDLVRERIQQMENHPLNAGTDAANAELERLRGQLDQALREQQNLNQAMNDMNVQEANEAYLRLQQIIGDTERQIRDHADEQGRLNSEGGGDTGRSGGMTEKITEVLSSVVTVENISEVLNLSDQMTSAAAGLERINDGLQTAQELQNMVYLSSERARGSYQEMAGAVSNMGSAAGDAFGSTEEIVAFTEQVSRQFQLAGMDSSESDGAMEQMAQMMGSGGMGAEEYSSMLEQAPNMIQTIADYLGVPEEKLEDMAAAGQITSDTVKAAVFAAADETNAKFESMPMTFEQIWTSMGNTALMGLQPLLRSLSDIANSTAFQQMVAHAGEAFALLAAAAEPLLNRIGGMQGLWAVANGAINGLLLVGGAVLGMFGLLVDGVQLLMDNWSWLSPIIYGIIAALLVYNATALIAWAQTVKQAALTIWKAVCDWAECAAVVALTLAQNGLNAALAACPLVWIIILIIALVALFYAAVAAVNHFAGTSASATGIICGVFMSALAVVGNLLVALINSGMDLFAFFWNYIAAFANFFGNVFNDPVGAIARLFFDLADNVLSLLETVAGAIDTMFGTEFADAVSGWRNSLGGWVDETFGKGEEVMKELDFSDRHLGRFEYSEAWDKGYSFGEGIEDKIMNFDPASLFGESPLPSPDEYANSLEGGGIGSGIENISENTGAMTDTMDITGEELKYLRDIAEQEAINRFTTAEISIEQTNHNTIRNGLDLDGVISGMTDAVNEAIYISTEGVHA